MSMTPRAAFTSLLLTNEPNKLACYITQGLKGLPGTNTLAYWASFLSYEENEYRSEYQI